MKYLLACCCLLLLSLSASATSRDIIDDANLLKNYLEQKRFGDDSTAQAVILYEKGSSFLEDGKIYFTLVRTIKILGKDAIDDLARIDISYNRDGFVKKIKGTTYNLENGKVIRQDVERSDILEDRLDRNTTVNKFNLPSVKEGSVIHYSYVREQPATLFTPSWDFQGQYPTLYSEYSINFPRHILYDAIERVDIPMTRARNSEETDTCISCSIDNSFGTSNAHTWVRRNIPAFISEPYMSSDDNYLERIKIHLKGVIENGTIVNIYKNWTDFSRKYYYQDNDGCGQVYRSNSFLDAEVASLVKDKTTELEKSKAVYRYVRDHFELQRNDKGRTVDNIKEVFSGRTGSAEGINLLLTAMLRTAGINSAPVLLSTRKNERLSDIYPDPVPINYLISTVFIDNKRYFLDASQHDLPFGLLLPECYNGYCRIVSKDGGNAFLNPDSLFNKSVIIVSIGPDEQSSGKLRLKVEQQLGQVTAIQYRKEWRKDAGRARKDIAARLEAGYSTHLDQLSIKNLEDPDAPLTLEYEAGLDLGNAGTLYFDPYFVKFFDTNPFTATTRKYPVEMGYQQDINYIFRFQLPQDYMLDDYPKSSIIRLGQDGVLTLRNVMAYDEAARLFSLNSRYTTRSTAFFADSYTFLRNFYESLIEEQQKKIVLKRIP